METFRRPDYENDLNQYLYIFVRQDIYPGDMRHLSPEYQAVQASHVAFKAGMEFNGLSDPSHTFFTLCGVKDENELREIKELAKSRMLSVVEFEEPDYNIGLSAIAIEPIFGVQRKIFSRYKLLTFN